MLFENNSIVIWDINSWEKINKWKVKDGITEIKFTSDNKSLVEVPWSNASSKGVKAKIRNIFNANIIPEYADITYVDFSPDGKNMCLVSNGSYSTIYLNSLIKK